MGATTWRGTAVIDGGEPVPAELVESVQVIDVSTSGPDTDPKWSTFDAAGHFHAVASDGTYPTLRLETRHGDCDELDGYCSGECGGGSSYICRACGATVDPGMIPGPHYRTMPGLRDWSMVYVSDRPPKVNHLSVQFTPNTEGQPVLFGFGIVGDLTVEGGPGGGVRATVQLYGNGALGRIARPAPKPAEPTAPEVLEKLIADAQVALAKLRRTA